MTHTQKSDRFTIVTPNYNMGGYLPGTIESVLQNLKPGDEYFVIDGGSTDDSVDVIKRYEQFLSGWVSETDQGYADALRKGFDRANAAFFYWVNSGDLLLSGALERARKILVEGNFDFIFGDDLLINERDEVVQVINGRVVNLRAMMLYAGWTPLQESCFWTRELYEKVGGIDSSLKCAADYDLFLRMSACAESRYVPAIFGAFRRHVGQLSWAKASTYKIERRQCRSREFKKLPVSPFLPLICAYFWFKVRWRVRLQANKHNMSRLVGKIVTTVSSQDT